MKKHILLAGLIIGAFCLASCNKEDINLEKDGKTIVVNAVSSLNTEADTKTSLSLVDGVYKPSWEEGDQLGLYTNNNSNVALTIDADDINSGNVATFHGTITGPSANNENYVFYTYYPKSAYQVGDNVNNLKLTIPTEQHPTIDSFDPAADILISRPETLEINKGAASADLSLSFKRTVSVFKFTFSDFDGVAGTEQINRLTLTLNEDATSTNYLSGRVKVNLVESTMESYNSTNYGFPNVIVRYYADMAPQLSSANVFVVVAPFTLSDSKTMTIRIETNDHIITKTMTASGNKSFEAGVVTPINLKLDKDLSNCTIANQVEYTQKTIAEVRALGTAVTNISQTWKIRGVVMSDRTVNMDSENIVLQDGTAVNSGIVVKTSEAHEYNKGDVLEVVITGGSLSKYKELLQLTPFSSAEIKKVGTNTPYAATVITVPQLKTGNYESMYVKIENTQVSSAHNSGTLYNTTSYGKVNMETVNDAFVMYIYSAADASFKDLSMPAGSGSLYGIAYVYNTTYQVIPQSSADISELNQPRFVAFGTPVFSGTMTAGTALSGCTIAIPVNNITSAQTYKVSVTATGAGSAGITNPFAEASVTTDSNNKLVVNLTGTPTTAGAVVFTVVIKDNTGVSTLATLTLNKTVESGDEFKITLDFSVASTYPEGFPTSPKGFDETAYTFGGYSFSFFGTTSNGGYGHLTSGGNCLIIGQTGSYILLPAIVGKKLTKVVVGNSSGCSTTVQVAIYDNEATPAAIAGGAAQTYSNKPSFYTYNLTSTSVNTSYQIRVMNGKNLQIKTLELTYTNVE